jgi:hypothetical protein
MAIYIMIVQGLVELLGVGGFVVWYLTDMWWVMVVGGLVMVLDDICDVSLGTLNPLFPVVFAIVLAMIIDPWYVGVFWSLACFKFLDMPGALAKIFVPHRARERVLKQMHERRGGLSSLIRVRREVGRSGAGPDRRAGTAPRR